jgi:aspartate 1-decarboxylase
VTRPGRFDRTEADPREHDHIVMSYGQYERDELTRHRPTVVDLGGQRHGTAANTAVRMLTTAG